jgi:hypothetical protein
MCYWAYSGRSIKTRRTFILEIKFIIAATQAQTHNFFEGEALKMKTRLSGLNIGKLLSRVLILLLLAGLLSLNGTLASDPDELAAETDIVAADPTDTLAEQDSQNGEDPAEAEDGPDEEDAAEHSLNGEDPADTEEDPADTEEDTLDEEDSLDEDGPADAQEDALDEEELAETEEMPAPEEPEVVTGGASISGFLWVDGSGMLKTDWNGLYDEGEWPLAGYDVYLYEAGNLAAEIAVAQTDCYGVYVFGGLEPGDYVVGLTSATVGGIEYLLPMMMTAECKFAIDMGSWAASYTATIHLEEEQAAEHINAGMRLPMGIMPLVSIQLANLANANKNDTVVIDGRTWVVVKTDTTTTSGQKYVYLIMQGSFYDNSAFGSSTNYDSSLLRGRMTSVLNTYLPTIQAIAVKPTYNAHNSLTALTAPTSAMALVPGPGGSRTIEDILFAPSYGDMREWINGNTTSGNTDIPSNHPLHTSSSYSFSGRFYCRSSAGAFVTGVLRRHATNGTTVNQLNQGIPAVASGDTYCSDVPAVWVRAGAVDRAVNVFYVDTEGNPIGTPDNKTYTVKITNGFTLNESSTDDVPKIPGYEYKEWKKGSSGTPASTTPALSSAEVISGTDIYLIYEQKVVVVTEKYVDLNGGGIGVIDTEEQLLSGEEYGKTIPAFSGYTVLGYKWDDAPSGAGTYLAGTAVPAEIIDEDRDIYFVYAYNYRVTYKANGGTGEDYVDDTGLGVGAFPYTVKSETATGFSGPPAKPVFMGWNSAADGSGTPYAAGAEINISGHITLYAQWAWGLADVIVSKRVAGEFANRSKEFKFTLFLTDENEDPVPDKVLIYEGGIVSGSGATVPAASGSFTTDAAGQETFSLAHGQMITIKDVPAGNKIRIVENAETPYIYLISFKDDEQASYTTGNDTKLCTLAFNKAERRFDFLNERDSAPPTGIREDNRFASILPLFATLILLAGWLAGKFMKRKMWSR